MYCGCCGTDDNKIITQNIEQDGNTVTISYFGVCKNCGELLGIKEFYSLTDWDYIAPKIVRETLLSFNGKGKFIRR